MGTHSSPRGQTEPGTGQQGSPERQEAALGRGGAFRHLLSLSWMSMGVPVTLLKSFWGNSLIQGCSAGLGTSFPEWSDILRDLGSALCSTLNNQFSFRS